MRLVGDWSSANYDFTGVGFVGSTIVIDAGGGNDAVVGSAQADAIAGGQGDDTLDGAGGSDTYRVSGNLASGFAGTDRYADSGTQGVDTIVAHGAAVDIGIAAISGIEVIDASAATGLVRVVGSCNADRLDFGAVTLKSVGTFDLLSGDDSFTGSAGEDTVYGGWGKDNLAGGNGNDKLVGDGDSDSLAGGAGSDTLVGGQGDDSVDGGDGSDTYVYSNTLASGWGSFNGFDTITDRGTTGTDTIRAVGTDVDIGLRGFGAAATGVEVIDGSGASAAVRMLGDSGADVLDFRGVVIVGNNVSIDAGHGNDSVTGSAGADLVFASFGDDALDGAGGSDTYRVSGNLAGGWGVFNGYDAINDSGTSGSDTIVAAGTAAVDIGVKSLSGIERIDASGASGGARLLGDSGANRIDLRSTTLVGITAIETGSGTDMVWGSAGVDRIAAGNDNDTVDAGAGDDLVTGGSGDDSLSGGADNDNLDGGSGADQLLGGTGNDTITGGAGNDTVNGGAGSDVYLVSGTAASGSSSWGGYDSYADDGATGTDTLRAVGDAVDIGLRMFSAASTGVEVIDASAATGLARIYGDTGADSLDFRGTALIGAIVIDGNSGNDSIAGSATADDIRGGNGADLLAGNGGADRLDGGSGNDMLADAFGADTMVGGSGKDRFALAHNDGSTLDLWGGSRESGRDWSADVYTLVGSRGASSLHAVVHDFEAGLDKIDLSQLRNAANAPLTMSDLVIDYAGGNARVGFAAGVQTLTNASVDQAYLTLLNVSALSSSSFAMTTTQLPAGTPTIEPVLPLLAG